MSLILSQQASSQIGNRRLSNASLPRRKHLCVVETQRPRPSGLGFNGNCMSANGTSSGPQIQVCVSKDDVRITAPNVDLESLPDYLKKECLLFYYPDQEILAKKIAQASSSIQLSEVKWAYVTESLQPTKVSSTHTPTA